MITSQEMALVEQALTEALASDVELLRRASESVVRSGGKRLRPKVVLLAYRAAGGQDIAPAVPVAAAVELVHTASLVHDDINDQSALRRGQSTVNARWGSSLALMVGDYIFVKLLGLLADCGSRSIAILAGCCTAIVEGETLQMLHTGDFGMGEAFHLEIVRKKTAAVFAACGELGAVLAGATEEQVAALASYGQNLGMAFQIRDDMLDLVGERDALGKPVHADLDQGKVNLAMLYALRHVDGAAEVARSGDRERVVSMLRDAGALDYAGQQARAFAEQAIAALNVLPASEARSELRRLADYAVAREL